MKYMHISVMTHAKGFNAERNILVNDLQLIKILNLKQVILLLV